MSLKLICATTDWDLPERMASMFSNVLGYLCPKSQENATSTGKAFRRTTSGLPDTPGCGGDTERENECGVVYGIEDQDDWQIVRKMSDASGDQEDSLDDGSGEALFALEEDGECLWCFVQLASCAVKQNLL